MANELQELTQKLLKFRDERDWSQFHTLKNLAESLIIEAGEVLELFQWKTDEESRKFVAEDRKKLAYELADVLNHLLLLAYESGVDLDQALRDKITINEERYPEDKARGSAEKYTAYQDD